MLPAACVFALLMTASSGVALVEAIGEVAAFAERSADSTAAFAAMGAAEAQAANISVVVNGGGAHGGSIADNAIVTASEVAAAEMNALPQVWVVARAVHDCASDPEPTVAALCIQTVANAWLNAIVEA